MRPRLVAALALVLPLALLPVAAGTATAAPTFQAGFLSYDTPVLLLGLALQDFDHDGFPDIAVASYQNGLIVLRGHLGGTYTTADTFVTPSCYAVATGDLNGDGQPDLVSIGQNLTTVYLGKGDLTFQPPVHYGGGGPSPVQNGLAVADIDGDGKLDVVVSDSVFAVRVWRGVGDGTLGPPIARLPATGGVNQIVATDLNGDGRLDIAFSESTPTGSTYQVVVYLNEGGGTFGPGTTYFADSSYGIAVGDVDGDGKPDLVSGGWLFRGNGDGTFAAPVLVGEDSEFGSLLADFDGDGKLDLITLGGSSSPLLQSFRVQRGNGNGTFGPGTFVTTGCAPAYLAAGDVDRDGLLDLVVGCYAFGQVCIHRGLGAAGFQSTTSYDLGADPTDVAVADVDGDGRQDVLALSGASARLRIWPGNGDGTLGTPVDLPTVAGAVRIAVGDVNGDGIPDLVTANGGAGSISYFRGTGGGSFAPRVDLLAVGTIVDVAIADVGGDGINDVVALGGSLSVFPGMAGTSLGARLDYPATGVRLATGNLNGDAQADVFVVDPRGSQTQVLMGQPGGGFGPATLVPLHDFGPSLTYHSAVIVDVNGDGHQDLLAITWQGGTGEVELNNGAGSFTAAPSQRFSTRTWETVVADLDRDGKPDLVTANNITDNVGVYFGNGTGGFVRDAGYGTRGAPYAVAVGDLDGDGYPDIVSADAADPLSNGTGTAGWVTVMRNNLGHPASVGGPRVPIALAISRVWPLPASDRLRMVFALPARGEVTAELLDVTGRRVQREALGVLDPGSRESELRLGAGVKPGIYWLRVSQGAHAVVAKAAVVR